MQNNTYYKFIGVINSFNICPDFVRPVFEKDGKHYFQQGKNGIICSFKEVPKELDERISRLFDINVNTNISIKEKYKAGDEPIICFRLEKDNYFISDITNFVPFIKNFKSEDYILMEEIDTFIDGVNNKNRQKKKLLEHQSN